MSHILDFFTAAKLYYFEKTIKKNRKNLAYENNSLY